MSGAQAKAAVICGCVGVIAEVSYEALKKRWAYIYMLQDQDGIGDLLPGWFFNETSPI
jgi:urocanate hydratase